jgi:tetratricopeptide (TPR) repeat protein
MKRNHLFKVLLLFIFCFSITVPLSGCRTQQDKEIVVAKNVKEELNSVKREILELIQEGNILLQAEKFPEAKASYEKAISKDKTNENTYLEIKNNYVKAKRFDDAYYIIKLAIDNNVSTDSMSKILEEIKTNFSVIKLEDTTTTGNSYELPTNLTVPVTTIPNPVTIRWVQKKVDTSNSGNFTFDGYIDEYGRRVQLTLTVKDIPKVTKKVTIPVKETVKSNSIGFINDIYEENKNTYIKFDDVQFYRDTDAQKEYAKDGFPPSEYEFGYDYYIRNKEINNKPYILSSNCSINICAYKVNPNIDKNSHELTTISQKDFKTYINKWSNIDELDKEFGSSRALLFSITTEDDVITSINMEYTP